jgi:hypothetical protein
VSAHTQLAAAVLGAVLTAAAAAYYAWHRGRELHREMDAVLDHIARFENNLLGDPNDPRDSGELGRQSRNLERLRLIVESEPPPPTRAPEPEPEQPPPATARMPVVAALIPTTTGPATGPADIPATDDHGDPPDRPSARAYSLTGPRPRPPGAHRPPKEREA